eukprot:1830588-Prymnesium_polylepis.1
MVVEACNTCESIAKAGESIAKAAASATTESASRRCSNTPGGPSSFLGLGTSKRCSVQNDETGGRRTSCNNKRSSLAGLFGAKDAQKRGKDEIFDDSLNADDVDALLMKLRSAEKHTGHVDVHNEITVGVLLRKSRHVKPKRMLPPDGKFWFRWELFSIPLSVIACILAPFELAFPASFDVPEAWSAVDISIDAVFLLEVAFRFRT